MQIIFLIRFATAAALGTSALGGEVWIAAVAWLLATLAAYVFNGVMDVTEDRANGSTRPISRGALPVPVAAGGVVVAGALALAIGGIVDAGGLLPVLILAHLACGYAYSGAPFYGKRRGSTAALLVLGMGVLTYAAGWQAAGAQGGVPVLLLGITMSLWMAGVGAVSKDLSDAEGDAAGGRKTPVVIWGDRRVRILVSLNAVLIAAGYLIAAKLFAPTLVPSAIVLGAGAVAVCVLSAATRGATTRDGRRAPYRAFMVTQYGVHLAVLGTLLLAGL
ncbi:UbiA family prenyltransferase [Nocardia sp. NPDC088792]|uniref:UbiA family prenyltransferase n=1 Tax=Nocardia sp. NPDC088792 TaxID=3364332 RepID=UPI00380503F3